MLNFQERPNDSRGFVHGRIARVAASFIPGGSTALNVISNIRDRGGSTNPASMVKFNGGGSMRNLGLSDSRRRAITSAMNAALARGDTREAASFRRELGAQGVLGTVQTIVEKLTGPTVGTVPCVLPYRRAPDGTCQIFLGDKPGRDDAPVGDAVMGRYGAALQPGSRMIDRAVCLRGMVLGNDGLCYNRRDISNKERMWPRGARPLGTPEEMRAVRIASRFGGRLERTNKRMMKIGLLKSPRRPSSRRRPAAAGKGITVIDT